MSLTGRHIKLNAAFSFKNALRGGTGLVFLFTALLFGLTVANIIITPVESLLKEFPPQSDRSQALSRIVDQAQPVLNWFLGSVDEGAPIEEQAKQEAAIDEWSNYLLHEKPAILSAMFFILFFGMPFIIPLGSFNQFAGDIGNRGFRYLLLRTTRTSIFFGRLISTVLWTILVHAIVIATVGVYLHFKLKIYPGENLLSWSLQGLLFLSALSLPYIALCAWVSTWVDSSLVALILCNLIIAGVLFASFLLSKQVEAAQYLKYLLPWGVQNKLLAPATSAVMTAASACVGYSLVYGFLGWRHFNRRDL